MTDPIEPYTGTLTAVEGPALADLVMQLRTQTPLGRINDDEAQAIFARLTELGFRIYRPEV